MTNFKLPSVAVRCPIVITATRFHHSPLSRSVPIVWRAELAFDSN